MKTWKNACLFGIVGLCTLLGMGCRAPAATPQMAAPTRAATRQTMQVQANANHPFSEYPQAIALYRAGDYKGALAKIETLLAKPGLSGEQRAFLERQKAICEGKPEVNSSSPVRSATPPASLEPKGDCGPRALAILLKRMQISATVEELGKLAKTDRYGTTLQGLAEACQAKGVTAEGEQMDGNALKRYEGMAVVWADGDHYIALLKVAGDQATIQDPNHDREEVIETETLLQRSGGILLTVQRTNSNPSNPK